MPIIYINETVKEQLQQLKRVYIAEKNLQNSILSHKFTDSDLIQELIKRVTQ